MTAAIILAAGAVCSDAQTRQRTTRGKLKVVDRSATEAAKAARFVATADSLFSLTGYDKPLRATKESAFLINNSADTLRALVFTIEYRDMQGRQLHKKMVKLNAEVPAGETRKISWLSWDSQHTFYYHRSPQPRSSGVTPYDVRCRIDSILINP